MLLPHNNWSVLGIAIGIWLFSWFFMMSFHAHPTIGNDGYYVWTAFKAALPLIAAVCMYAIGIRTAASRERSKPIIHLTYSIMLALFIPTMWGGMEISTSVLDAPMGAIVDFACFTALVLGTTIFWFFRAVEIVVKKLSRKHDVG